LCLGTKAKATEAMAVQARMAIRIGSSEVWPQMLNGEERPAWEAMVRS
jgi:hypothetical protein